jgi:hypothetical protein
MDSHQRVATLLAFLFGASLFVGFTLNAPQETSPTFRVTAECDKLLSPGGCKVFLKFYLNEQSPITHLSARLSYSSHIVNLLTGESIYKQYYSDEEFLEVTSTSPMSLGDHVTKMSWSSGMWGIDSDVRLSGTLANGEKFNVEARIDWI